MADMVGETREYFEWSKRGVLSAGTRVVITVGPRTIFDQTVPAGKEFDGIIRIDGILKAV